MQNQIYPQYIQPNYGQANQYMQSACTAPPCFAPQQSYPSPSVGAVNIQIYNPTANPMPYNPYPYNYNNMFPAPSNNIGGQIDPSMNQSMNLNNNMNGVAAQGNGEEGKKTEEKKEDKPKVALTDDYIRTLENYLNSQDKKIRLMGAKELLDRFKEDETRKDDAALTALLNKTLQDPAETVKFVALTALDTGYATGNDETAQILSAMQQSNSSYGEDAALASRILLKMSGYKANAEAAALQGNPQAQNMQQNLNAAPMQNAQQSLNAAPSQAMQAQDFSMPQPNLSNIQQGGMEKIPTGDGTLMTPPQNAQMSQSMQINPNGQTNMQQNMTPPPQLQGGQIA